MAASNKNTGGTASQRNKSGSTKSQKSTRSTNASKSGKNAAKNAVKNTTGSSAMASGRSTQGTGTRSSRGKGSARSKTKANEKLMEAVVLKEVIILLVLALAIIMELSVFKVGSKELRGFLFGTFGVTAYIFPAYLFFGIAFYLSNNDNPKAIVKLLASFMMFCCICSLLQMNALAFDKSMTLSQYYKDSKEFMHGGGILGGIFCKLICPVITVTGNYVICIILLIAGLVIITERSFLGGIKSGSTQVYNTAREDFEKIKEANRMKHEERETQKEESAAREEHTDKRIDKKARGVETVEIVQQPAEPQHAYPEVPGMKEIVPDIPLKKLYEKNGYDPQMADSQPDMNEFSFASEERIQEKQRADVVQTVIEEKKEYASKPQEVCPPAAEELGRQAENASVQNAKEAAAAGKNEAVPIDGEIDASEIKKYVFPPLELLKSGASDSSQSRMNKEISDTAAKLQQTLRSFGVGVTLTDISYGPSVTRYELQPDQGVKVGKIVALADDIKLNLAAADIRIEAPIPGKAAVGIEVPNKENHIVMLRDLLASDAFKKHSSNIAFAVGKDIGGQTVVTDIAKMPHLLIAGATGSGKSVCINTLIMSILYKAHPNDVKLIMVDPKVVELSVYNGIPHLLIPVVTDPKKAAGALNWAVAEMADRYNKFSKLNVRDLKGYNEKIEAIKDIEDENKPQKLPQIVIIVDELADLMMVAPGEVEDAICRLAQMARAAGLHLIIATQRPSVNVITGLIKANVPSRIAFSVSSGVDSRTIIDMNGAEKLLGKGDMLFYPSGYPKPVRVQGAFVSDKEVAEVVRFLAEQGTETHYNEEVHQKISNGFSEGAAAAGGSSDNDNYFAEAGRFIIEKEKASIGLLQRVFKIGFNRAARIMDQLFEAGVVGPEEGTKPRKILMTMEEFEQYLKGGNHEEF